MEPSFPLASPAHVSGVVLSAKIAEFGGLPYEPIGPTFHADGPNPEVFLTVWFAGVEGDGVVRFLIRRRTEQRREDLGVLIADPRASMIGTNVPLGISEPGVVILELYDVGADAVVWEHIFEVDWSTPAASE